MTGSKSSQTTRSVVLGFLALWSIVSLIIIVVWATSPDLKSSAHCRAQLHSSEEKLLQAQDAQKRDRRALEGLVEEVRANLTSMQEQMSLLQALMDTTNTSLERCTLENEVLRGNNSLLEKHVELHILMEKNLTVQNHDLQDEVEVLQQNVTELTLHTQACQSLQVAAESLMMAATIKNQACNSSKLLLRKQLLRCTDLAAADKQSTHSSGTSDMMKDEDEEEKTKNSSESHVKVFSLLMFLCCSLHLII